MIKKKYAGLAGAAAAAAAWCICRNKKYPLAEGYPLLNKFFIPGLFLSKPFLRMANSRLADMELPACPCGIVRRTEWIDAQDGERLRLTICQPEESMDNMPCLVYFHGGGFCLGDAPYIHENVAQYAKEANCMVVFVHYRTSDRYPFPVPFMDCYTALEYVREHCEPWHIDRKRIAVGGDSAGGALAAACAIRSRECGKTDICFQMLVYPVMDARMRTESMKKYTDSPIWNARLTKRMWEIYLRNGDMGKRCYASPLEAGDFRKLPPAYVEVEQYDCLHDEGVEYFRELRKAGVPARLREVKGTFHGFDVFRNTRATEKMLKIRSRALYEAFCKQEP